MDSPPQKPHIQIYTDGACSPNPGFGGWGVVMISPQHHGHRKEISGAEANSTNNRMELLAVIRGLEQLNYACYVDVYTDSTYVCNAFKQRWIEQWQKKGWVTSARQPVMNQDLWKQLLTLIQPHEITWHWVKGHADHKENNRCDELAVQARKELHLTLQKA
jgi:ribonuclease HI